MPSLIMISKFLMANFAVYGIVGTALLRAASKTAAGLSWLSVRVIGHWEWHPPSWLPWIFGHIVAGWRFLWADTRRAITAGVNLLSVLSGWVWYKTRPVPHYVTYTMTAPGLTEYGEKGISSIKPFVVEFSESAAPLQQIEKAVTAGIEISPKIAG